MQHVPRALLDEPIWLEIARRETGAREVAGAAHNQRVLAYHAATRLKATTDETAWCAAFVCWCLEQAGIRSTRSAKAASFATWGRATYLEPGAIVVLAPPVNGRPNPDNANSGHVGFLVGVDGPDLLLLSGNSANQVRISTYDAARLVACRWPLV